MAEDDLAALTDEVILERRAAIEAELRRRGIRFSVGELGEALALAHFASTPNLSVLQAAPVGTKNVDALSRDGARYSIKTVQRGRKTGTVYPDLLDRDLQLFEFMLVVGLSSDYSLKYICRLDWDMFRKVRAWDKRMQAWYVPVNQRRLAQVELLLGAIA